MAERQPTKDQIDSQRALARWFPILGIGFILFGLYLSVFLVPDVVRTMLGPRAMTLQEAAQIADPDRTYARLEGGNWDCDSLVYVQGLSPSHSRYETLRETTKSTELFYTDPGGAVAVLVTLSGEVPCETLAGDVPAGYLFSLGSGTRAGLERDGRLARVASASTVLEMCGYCGRENSLIGALFGIAFIVGGVGMFVWGRVLSAQLNRR